MQQKPQNFQIFAKPASCRCNLSCSYCYYLDKEKQFGIDQPLRMVDELLEEYIRQHIAASNGGDVNFSWHGGEPTLLGVDYFRRIVEFQRRYRPAGAHVSNGIQTNGTLITEEWGRFLAKNRFNVGLSLDGPAVVHDVYRKGRQGQGTHEAALRGYRCLTAHGVPVDILCVVNDLNVMYPLQVYRFFKSIGAKHVSFLPLVELVRGDSGPVVSERTVNPEAFGAFLCTIFDEWLAGDVGLIKIQIFEEALRTAFHQDHSLCLFRPTCGNIPVLEHNGDVFACDHFVEPAWNMGNIRRSELAEILASERLRAFGESKKSSLPAQCSSCEVLAMCNGECPKNRWVEVEGESEKLNYLCPGYLLFFKHCRPFIREVSQQWRREQGQKQQQLTVTTGRNEPCPCGSGRKFKRCCLKDG